MKKMKMVMTVLCMMLMVFGVIPSASALTITPTTTPQWTGTQTSNAQILAYLDALNMTPYPDFDSSTEVYKADLGGDPTNYDITADIMNALYLLVKDGNSTPAWYLFYLPDINGVAWNGYDTLELRNFWVGRGSISHVAIYGGVQVPEPATLLLLGLGLVGLAGVRRGLKK